MEKEKNPKKQKSSETMLAVVRVRGKANLREVVKRTFESLNLYNKNWCVLLEDTPSHRGMLAKVKDFITWGTISKETMDEMVSKRGEEYKERLADSKNKIEYCKFIEISGRKYKKYFRLSPPKKGFGKAGVKTGFAIGGALGDRKEKMDDLIKRMI